MKDLLINGLFFLKLDILGEKIRGILHEVHVKRLSSKYGIPLKFVSQGKGCLTIEGTGNNFYMDPTSHLKSNTFIECTGGVSIGRYFHPGRGLTIFSTNHNYENDNSIPYDAEDIIKPVIIKD
ncbi:MAG TPA: hypothetical protein VK705_04095, partial [Ferruginibacter sp.]|nr:hypothetical protein [Ferruginibacter sp.]